MRYVGLILRNVSAASIATQFIIINNGDDMAVDIVMNISVMPDQSHSLNDFVQMFRELSG